MKLENNQLNLVEDEKDNFSMIDNHVVFKRKSPKTITEDIRKKDTVENILKNFEPDVNIYVISNGGFSIVDLIVGILDTIEEPADLDISTWTARNADIRKTENLLISQKIKSVRFLFDTSFKQRQPEFYANAIKAIGKENVKQTNLHAKLYLIKNSKYNITILTSANLNNNTRAETFYIQENKEFYDFNKSWFDSYFA